MKATSNRLTRARPLLGTFVEVSVSDAPRADMDAAVDAAFAAVADVHRLMSFHDAGSDVGCLNSAASAQPVTVHAWTYQVLELAADMHRRSRGAFDIAVAPRLQELGLLPRGADEQPSDPAEIPGASAIELLPDCRVRLRHPSMRIDLGGIAKGFAVDRAIDVLRDHAMPSGLVNAGGDLSAFGPAAQTIQVRDPRAPERLMCRVDLMNQALASSAGRLDLMRSTAVAEAAVIDPESGEPPRTIRAATVCAPSCMVADALTKVVMVAGERAAGPLEHYRASAIFVSAEGDVRATTNWQGSC
jgi:thiamine biosynthesis lipoprotein